MLHNETYWLLMLLLVPLEPWMWRNSGEYLAEFCWSVPTWLGWCSGVGSTRHWCSWDCSSREGT